MSQLGILLQLTLMLISTSTFATPKTQAQIEIVLQDYIKAPSSHPLESGASDIEDFKLCAKTTCQVVWRQPLEVESSTAKMTRYFAFIDLAQNGTIVIRRRGCYILEEQKSKLKLSHYLADCEGK